MWMWYDVRDVTNYQYHRYSELLQKKETRPINRDWLGGLISPAPRNGVRHAIISYLGGAIPLTQILRRGIFTFTAPDEPNSLELLQRTVTQSGD